MATQKYEQVRDILKMVYCHQYEDDGNWPQWFMFDRYFAIQQEESHGDIIVWPLKVLSDYLTVTQDFSILEEKVPYTLKHSFQFTENKASILEHAKKKLTIYATTSCMIRICPPTGMGTGTTPFSPLTRAEAVHGQRLDRSPHVSDDEATFFGSAIV